MKTLKTIIAIFAISLLFVSCGKKVKNGNENEISGKLVVFHAGSLSVPFKEITEEFNKEYPDVEIMLEASGSRTCARKITDLKRPCDIMASADYTVINKLLIPEYASWNIKFATNEMSIVYHEASRRSKDINSDNWYKILMEKDIIFGRSDPNADPCGYRAVLTMKLAGEYYKDKTITDNLLAKNLNYIRPKETDLLALLEAEAIDYIFLYRSVAQQHSLKYLIIPDEVNLKKTELTDFYKKATVQISGKKPGEFITKTGAPMVYGITIPKNPPNKAAAMAFVDFILSRKGMAIMEKLGQPSAIPSQSETYKAIPEELKPYAKK